MKGKTFSMESFLQLNLISNAANLECSAHQNLQNLLKLKNT